MKRLIRQIGFAWLAALLLQPVLAQPASEAGSPGQRVQGGGINYAPQPAVYTVTVINASARTVTLRDADGRTGVVHVADSVYDLYQLKPGDKIRVDFIEPAATDSKLSAASIWPEK